MKEMLRIIICTVIVLFSFSIVVCNGSNGVEVDPKEYPHANLLNMRCTRRFSPGVCVEEVAPVWTFVFMAQNCTERLGCTNNFRTNRFRTYRLCMKRCRVLIDKYLELVELQNRNNSSSSEAETKVEVENERMENETGAEDKNLREGLADYFKTQLGSFKEQTESYEEVEEGDYYATQQDTRYVVYKDVSSNEDIMPPDVDYIAGEIRSEFDLQRW
ncbi:hypothetical protein SFRURICE_017214 [Spodoptera frugiperda]|nr:hypothetical protein SFRURICE_017214 [Spodoptera frugiperda]